MAQEKNVDVTIIAEADNSPDGISFRLESDLGNGDRLTFENDKKGDTFRVSYHLNDGNLGLKFRPRPDDAMWVVEGGPCPTSPATNDQYKPIQVSTDGKMLVVLNKNGFAAEYVYTLRFLKPDGTGVDWDPIVDNRNGGGRITLFQGCLLAAGGVAATILSAFGLRRLIGGKAEKEDG